MSRHSIIPKDPSHEIVVGWDPPLNTFFATVYKKDAPEEERVVEWVGAKIGDVIHSVEALQARIINYGIIDAETRAQLIEESD